MFRHIIKIVSGGLMIMGVQVASIAYASDMILKSEVSITNNSSYDAVVGPEPQDPQPELIKPGATIKNRPFAYTLFLSRFSKSGTASGVYVYYFNVSPQTNTIHLERLSTQTGKRCPITPIFNELHCSTEKNGITVPMCKLTVTFNADNTVSFNNNQHEYSSTLSQHC